MLSLNSISVGVSLLLGIFSTKIISVFLGTPGMAALGSFKNFASMVKSLATLGINNSLIKLFIENKDDKKELATIYSTFFWIFLFLSIILGTSVFAFSDVLSGVLFSTYDYGLPIRVFALALPLIVLNTFWLAIYNGLQLFRKIVAIQIISNIVIFAITALFVWQGNIKWGLLSIAVSELAMVIVTFIFVRSNRDYFRFDLQKVVNRKYIAVIRNFSVMALLSAVLAPLTLILIRNYIIEVQSVKEAGIWDGLSRLSSFYMVFFNTGLSLYYMPKLSSLKTDDAFKAELKIYFKTLVPLFAFVLMVIFLFRDMIVNIAFTSEFYKVKEILIWQLAGDLMKIMTLAFGFQILVKTMMKEYFVIEVAFNLIYLLLSFYLMKTLSIEGVVKAYFFSNLFCLLLVLGVFRKLIFTRSVGN